jgi:hypothetical protein
MLFNSPAVKQEGVTVPQRHEHHLRALKNSSWTQPEENIVRCMAVSFIIKLGALIAD